MFVSLINKVLHEYGQEIEIGGQVPYIPSANILKKMEMGGLSI